MHRVVISSGEKENEFFHYKLMPNTNYLGIYMYHSIS